MICCNIFKYKGKDGDRVLINDEYGDVRVKDEDSNEGGDRGGGTI